MKPVLLILALWLFLASPSSTFGQSWSGVLSSNRAINWTGAGLPATFPDGETTTNPWTPPTRTQCGSTLTPSGGSDTSAINAALAACTPGHYVLLGSGNFSITGNGSCSSGTTECINMYTKNGVTLRGSGAQATKLVFTQESLIQWGLAWSTGTCTWASGFSSGTTSITVTGCNQQPVANQIITLSACDSGYSGSNCETGTSADPGNLYICGDNTACVYSGEGTGGPQNHQAQNVLVSSVTGTCSSSCTIVFSPGIYMANFASLNSPFVTWTTTSSGGPAANPNGIGLEDLTVDMTGDTVSDTAVQFVEAYASWIKGVRIVGQGPNTSLRISGTKNSLFLNNYIYPYGLTDGAVITMVLQGADSDDLNMNNIYEGGIGIEFTGSDEGNVTAYNFFTNAHSGYYDNGFFEHVAGSAFDLKEANETGNIEEDATHGTHTLNTFFRNYISGWDPPLVTVNARGLLFDSFARFDNAVGNIMGTSGILTNYLSTPSNVESAYEFGIGAGLTLFVNDPMVGASRMLWGNCDVVNNACRHQSSEVPTSITPNSYCTASATPYSCCTGSGTGTCSATTWQNSVPSNNNLPCSFFLSTYTSTTCTPTYSGGTGLSFWKVVTAWTTFPTTPSSTSIPAFPPAGPDITSGPYVAGTGTAYDVPAALAHKYLPIDTSYQNSYTIASSSWSGGTETLTFNSAVLPSGIHTVGGFQISGGNCATAGAGTSTGTEVGVTGPSAGSTTQIQYALASNPGSCAGGVMLFPDVREFDEQVYEADPAGAVTNTAPCVNCILSLLDWTEMLR
jgi:hypothetical protein